MNARLRRFRACLMPTGMHPWMHPETDTRLWTGKGAGVYRAYDRIFDCGTHGWANLQSMQVNFPFGDDAQFARLHAAARLALPILPAIAASSPFQDGAAPGALDCRLEAYRTNAPAVPLMNGDLIPEPASSRAQYEREHLEPLYRALAPLDPEAVLRHEWVNARGAIARFDRNAIEIRVLDLQECPAADLALAAAIIDVVQLLYRENPEREIPSGTLATVLLACIRQGERARIDSSLYLQSLKMGSRPCEAGDVWRGLAERMKDGAHRGLWRPVLDFILQRGPLSRRMLDAVGAQPSRDALAELYHRLCECLERNRMFRP